MKETKKSLSLYFIVMGLFSGWSVYQAFSAGHLVGTQLVRAFYDALEAVIYLYFGITLSSYTSPAQKKAPIVFVWVTTIISLLIGIYAISQGTISISNYFMAEGIGLVISIYLIINLRKI